MLQEVLKLDKLCALRFITVINAYDCNLSYHKREGSSCLSNTNSCKSCKIHNVDSGFRAQPEVRKYESQNFREIKMSPFVFRIVTYLPREVKGTVINKIYFF